MERPTDVLRSEHRGIERMLRVTEVAARKLEVGEEVPADVFDRAIDYARGFTEKCHHAKEERNLFPSLRQHGVTAPVEVMLAEHEEGRRLMDHLAAAVEAQKAADPAAWQAVIASGRGYISLLRSHIGKEDGVLFPMADRILEDAEQQELAERFERVEQEEVGEGVHERYHGMIEDIEREMGIAPA